MRIDEIRRLKFDAPRPINNPMPRKSPRNRSLFRAARGLGLATAVAACSFIASAHEPSRPRHAGPDLPHGSGPGGASPETPYSSYYPEIGIDVRPELEHSPSNYQPDGYRLPGYDGKPAGAHMCRGAHGSSLSSAGIQCPPGEKRPRKGRYLSTDGS